MNEDETMSQLRSRARVLPISPEPTAYYVVVKMGMFLGSDLHWRSYADRKMRYLYEDRRMAEKLAMFHGGTVELAQDSTGKVYGK